MKLLFEVLVEIGCGSAVLILWFVAFGGDIEIEEVDRATD